MTAVFLSALAFGLALFALTRRRLLWGVLGVGAHSLALAGLYLSLAAPDVALTEAAVGFGLVTLIYLLAIRRTGKLVVVACPLYPILYQEGKEIAGLEWEILERFGRWYHRDLEIIWVTRREIPALLRAGEAHLGAGGFLPSPEDRVRFSRPLVPAQLVRQHVLAEAEHNGLSEKWFTFAVAPNEEELGQSLEEFLNELEAQGVLAELVRRYLE